MSPAAAAETLATLAKQNPALAADAARLKDLHAQKLWHPLTLALEQCLAKPEWRQGDIPLTLYKGFVSDFGHRLNPLKHAQLAVAASKSASLSDAASAAAFLADAARRLEASRQGGAGGGHHYHDTSSSSTNESAEPALFLRMHSATRQLEAGDLASAKAAVEQGERTLSRLPGAIDPSVAAAVHYAAALAHKVARDYAPFYRSAMQYLAFVKTEDLDPEFRLALAVDVGLAALLGEGVYSFAQLLMHPVAAHLDNSPAFSWLAELLRAFNRGDIAAYEALCTKHAAKLNAQPALVEGERRLREKVTVCALLALVSARPPDARRIALSEVARATKLPEDGVELLLMKALALGLIEGRIDQVAGDVSVGWVQPRVLDMEGIAELKRGLDGWSDRVATASKALEEEAGGGGGMMGVMAAALG
jgi:26S proteasome regulatory subunit N9